MMVFEDCGNCIAMEQSGYISEWQNLLLTLTSYYLKNRNKNMEKEDKEWQQLTRVKYVIFVLLPI